MLLNNHADTVGHGVHRQRVAPGPAPRSEEHEPDKFSLDGPEEWVDTPTFPDQITRGDKYYRLDRVEAKVFDLAKPEDSQEYSALLTSASKVGSNVALTHQDRQFCEQTGNWKVFVEIQFIKYRKLFVKDKRHE